MSGSPVVVGVDGSETSVAAARWAGAVAEKIGTGLHIVHVEPSLGRNLADSAAAIAAAAMSYRRDAVEILLKEASEAVRADRDVRVMVMGIPNVGKSTLINGLAGRKIAKTGNEPAVTRCGRWCPRS